MKKTYKKLLITAIFALFLIVPFASADIILVNSKDWRDVYSAMLYGGFQSTKAKFLVSDKHGPLILNSLDKTEPLEVHSSQRQPYVVGYKSVIEGAGFASVSEEKHDSMNLELAEELDVKKWVVLDDAYGYNAIAVAPYAALTKSYVLFANSRNIDEVVDLLDEKGVDELIIYGVVEREVRDALDQYDPEIINQDGDRFANNVEIVKKYREVYPQKQVVMTNGEFIESEIMSGAEPVLFIGRENVPDKIKEYIQSTDIEVGVLIGNELVGTATVVRRQVGISTFVKFAQGARAAAGAISLVEGLDRFPVPAVALGLEIISVKYNKLTGMIEITFRNNADIATYFKGTYTLKVGDQEFVFGDENPVFIGKNDILTMTYKVEGLEPDGGEMTLKAYVIYGEAKNALEFVIDQTFTVSTVEVGDEAQVTITKLVYDKEADKFLVYLENIGEVDAYVDAELVDLMIMGSKETISSEDVLFLKKGVEDFLVIEAELSDQDLEDNPTVHVRAHYGEREDGLIKLLEGDFEIVIKSFDIWTYLPIAIILVLLLLLIFGRKKCKNCGHKNPRGRKQCKKCGHRLK
ncbi:TPA: zinc ribbon domain-containing protein [Candidatus Woesearchaeota archaeon]|nr:zinc ribbon domain-containing protein [Candidatus Woesearchaeota archaeon]